MKIQVRAVLMLIVTLATMELAGCGHYNCATSANFGGNNACSPTNPGVGNGSGIVFSYLLVESGGGVSMVADELDLSTNSFQEAPGFVIPPLPVTFVRDGGTVVVNKKFLYIPFTDGTLYGFAIDGTTGALTHVPNSPYSTGTAGQPAIASDPAGHFVFVSDSATGLIHAFTISATDGSLLSVPLSPFASGVFAGQIATDGLGKFLYATEGVGSTLVAALAIDPSGALSPVSNSPFPFNMSKVLGEPSGKYLLGITESTSDVHVFAINAGAIAEVANSPFATSAVPESFAVQPNGNGTFVYTFDGFGSPVEGYQLSTSSGALTRLSGSPFTGVNLISGEFDQTGLFLFGVGVGQAATDFGPYGVDTGTGFVSAPKFGLLGYPNAGFAVTDLTNAP
jgi:6-phosphogluconolactonase (cycloisomerase 2 family)